jgi:hypothetical protein
MQHSWTTSSQLNCWTDAAQLNYVVTFELLNRCSIAELRRHIWTAEQMQHSWTTSSHLNCWTDAAQLNYVFTFELLNRCSIAELRHHIWTAGQLQDIRTTILHFEIAEQLQDIWTTPLHFEQLNRCNASEVLNYAITAELLNSYRIDEKFNYILNCWTGRGRMNFANTFWTAEQLQDIWTTVR